MQLKKPMFTQKKKRMKFIKKKKRTY